jgi:hypothetical protein
MSEIENGNAHYRLAGKTLAANRRVSALLLRLSKLAGDQTVITDENGETEDLSRALNTAVKNAQFLEQWYELSLDPRYSTELDH